MNEIWGALVVFLICPLIGGLPLIEWITYALTGRRLSQLGTGNVGVSAAFYHGGKIAGIGAVISEAGKGIIAVLLTRLFFPAGSVWEILSLIALIMGRYWMGKGAGTTNLVWGLMVHDPLTMILAGIIGMSSFTVFRDRTSGRLVGLFLLALILTVRHPNEPEYILASIALVSLMAGIYQRVPDDLDLPTEGLNQESQQMFVFFRGDQSLLSLNKSLDPQKVGQKAATLSQLKRWGYAVPDGWVLPAGDDFAPLLQVIKPSQENPYVVRSSAIGEDSETASAAGQYTTLLNITTPEDLETAILACQTSYNNPNAAFYRADKGQPEASIAVIVQKQIRGVFSGVVFSRDPVNGLNNDIVIESLPGDALQIVSGRVTPEQYRVNEGEIIGEGNIPPRVIQEVAKLARELEDLYHGIPQDIEWTHDGEKLWLLQSRPITNLQPVWTRKIAAEVIPGVIRPLTWSINQPLTCGVWGDIFTLVLGKEARDLDFNETAALHYGRAYFNATLLGKIFRRMGLPAQSLEFLTRGAKLGKPPILSTVKNIPGLLRLLGREWQLETDFQRDMEKHFLPCLAAATAQPSETLTEETLLQQIETLLKTLKIATYYSILAPLSFAIRQNIGKVDNNALDNSQSPEVASLESLKSIACEIRPLISPDIKSVEDMRQEMKNSPPIMDKFQGWLQNYGYLGAVGTDISVPRWADDPEPMEKLLSQYILGRIKEPEKAKNKSSKLQSRLNIKNKTTEIYSRLLCQVRWHFVNLESLLLSQNILNQSGDIFYLTYEEIKDLTRQKKIKEKIEIRREKYEKDTNLSPIPYVIYGKPSSGEFLPSKLTVKQKIEGIGASPGQIEGKIKVLKTLEIEDIEPGTILVVPYTDSGWSPLLSKVAGIIAEVGGQLSHGAIIAREYGIPAVMDVNHATDIFKNGQIVRIDGQKGSVEILKS
ncbi:MAG: hypothetical protein N5P05_000754 [Chroococcopsis gigantea SAG 12.99]|jgi:phosphoenolpyruvate synthase/pyruvate phosphate dikinase/glycerol-3-phosphate acyltransferase PlsY|nr:glycerol-3-phosphate acyltransferase [Chlorogloea purpurea SAG 13.99]MDV2999148.1 hypothetical protein [Chroococcopsis gigantea SAG 12.99]